MDSGDGVEPLFLQAKEAQPSVLAEYAGRSQYNNHGERVVAGQHLMQAESDIFLGWTRVPGPDKVDRDFYVRQLKDWKFSAPIEQMIPSGMTVYACLCGWTLARARPRAAPGWPGRGAGMRRQYPELAASQCQGHVTMTAEPPQNPVTEAVRSLEVRWIFPGQLEAAVAGWFGRFPARTESREDTYLLDPRLRGLSVKLRGGGALEVKAYRGSPGILEVAGRARGRLEFWQKWSFPFSPLRQDSGGPAGWRPVRKRRRISRFSGASGQIVAPAPGLGGEPRCEVELTEIRTRGQDWWTLGFEATGPADLLRSALEATAALVFAQALPGGAEPGPDESRSYAKWLG